MLMHYGKKHFDMVSCHILAIKNVPDITNTAIFSKRSAVFVLHRKYNSYLLMFKLHIVQYKVEFKYWCML